MGFEVIADTTTIRLSLSADSHTALDGLKMKIFDFIGEVPKNCAFVLTVELTMETNAVASANSSPLLFIDLLNAYEAQYKSIRVMCEELGIARASWHAWRSGKPPTRRSLNKLIANAPTEKLRAATLRFRDTIA